METLSNTCDTKNGEQGDENFTCQNSGMPVSSKKAIETKDDDVKNLKNHAIVETQNEKPLNEIPSEFNNLMPECSANNCNDILTKVPQTPVYKVVSPTIFENAVQAVKNLFSPAKAHTLFSRNNLNVETVELTNKKESNADESIFFDRSSPSNMEQSISNQKLSYSLNTFEMDNCLNERDWNDTSVKNNSSASEKHDNTNDSYLTTASGVDESFQSTVTHFDEITVDTQKAHNQKTTTEDSYVLNRSLNEILGTCEYNLDDTLTKNHSIGTSDDGILNNTFQVLHNGQQALSNTSESRKEEFFANSINISETHISSQNKSEDECSKRETLDGSKSYVIVNVSTLKPNAESYDEKCCVEDIKKMPNKVVSLENVDSVDGLLVEIVSENMERLTIRDDENSDNQSTYSCAAQDVDNESVLSQFSATNPSSETDCSSVFSGKSECALEKFPQPKSSPVLGNNFSTSTIVITKAELNPGTIGTSEIIPFPANMAVSDKSVGADSVKMLGHHGWVTPQERCGSEKVFLENCTIENSLSPSNSGITFDCSHNQNNINIYSPNSISDKSDNSVQGSKFHFAIDPLNVNLLDSEIHSSPVVDLDLKSLGLSSTEEEKTAGGCFSDETGIPLASQKSYTVLHNSNPDLSRPNVDAKESAIPGDKINDVILVNDSISQLTLTYGKTEEVANGLKLSIAVSSEGNFSNEVESFKHMNDSPTFNLIDASSQGSNSSEKLNNITHTIDDESEVSGLSSTSAGSRALAASESEGNLVECIRSEANLSSSIVAEAALPKSASVEVISNDGTYEVIFGDAASESSTTETFKLNNSVVPVSKEFIKEHVHGNGEAAIGPEMTFAVDNAVKKENETVFDMTVGVIQDESTSKDDLAELEAGSGDVENSSCNADTSKVSDCIDSEMKPSCKDGRFDDFLIPSDEPRDTEEDLSQLIQEQFTANDIAKICSVVCDLPELNLRKNIALVSQQFEKSFHEKMLNESAHPNTLDKTKTEEDGLSSTTFDFLESIKGKPSGRDYSRDSLYIKFDPLFQGGKNSSKITSISEINKENFMASPVLRTTNSCEPLVPITPLKQTASINSLRSSPVSSLSKKNETKPSNDKMNKLRDMVNEIHRLKGLYQQHEELHKEKMNNYEKEVTRLTGQKCVLEDKLKESEERQKTLVKNLNAQDESLSRLNGVLVDNLAYIETLTNKFEAYRITSLKEISDLKKERDNYLNHLETTEQALMEFYNKYEKCKKIIETYKRNEEIYKGKIEELSEAVEEYSRRMQEVKERATRDVKDLSDKMNEMKEGHAQDVCRFKALLRKTELKAQAIQEDLEQKIKENKALAVLCDELIEGKN